MVYDYCRGFEASLDVHRQEFREIASIGQGNFSKVFRVKSKFDGMEYALKRSFRAVATELEAKRWQQVGVAKIPYCGGMKIEDQRA